MLTIVLTPCTSSVGFSRMSMFRSMYAMSACCPWFIQRLNNVSCVLSTGLAGDSPQAEKPRFVASAFILSAMSMLFVSLLFICVSGGIVSVEHFECVALFD